MLKFLKCTKCGAMVELIHGGGELICCGELMNELVANSAEASGEKHIPFVQVSGGKLVAQVGSVLHPMEENHYIERIIFDDGKTVESVRLKPGDAPVAEVCLSGKRAVYAYCNIHGLWKTEIGD